MGDSCQCGNVFVDRNRRAIRVGDRVTGGTGLHGFVYALRAEENNLPMCLVRVPGTRGLDSRDPQSVVVISSPDPSTPQRDEGEDVTSGKKDPVREYGPVWLDRLSDRVDALITRMECVEGAEQRVEECMYDVGVSVERNWRECMQSRARSFNARDRLDALEERVEGLIGLSPASVAFVQDLPNRVTSLEEQYSKDRAVFMGGGFQALVDRVKVLEGKPALELCEGCGGWIGREINSHADDCSSLAQQCKVNSNEEPKQCVECGCTPEPGFLEHFQGCSRLLATIPNGAPEPGS